MKTDKKLSITVFFPTYNDAITIPSLVLETIYILDDITDDYEVLIINDASPDNTREVAEALAARFKRVKVINHEVNKGYGGALKSGFRNVTKEWIFYTDGDSQYDITEIVKLIEHIGEADVINGKKIKRSDSISRRIIGKIYHCVNKLIFKLPVSDVDCDFRLINRKVLEAISLTTDTGFVCVELIKRIDMAGFKILELPIHHYYRKSGRSAFFNFKNIIDVIKAFVKFYLEVNLKKKRR